MESDSLLFLIFTGAAVLSTIALFFRQPLRVAYIGVGTLLGPYGLAYISDANLLTDIAEFGIIFLLFLLGLDMQPKKLLICLTQDLLGNASKFYRLRPSELFYWTSIWV
jgi:Kef-type K+ transport system membrane component KefB